MILLKKINEHRAFFFILLAGVALRFIPLFKYEFSHDELSALSRTIFLNLSDEINYGAKITDTHPPLIQVFLYYWIKLFGYNEIAIKLPFLVCGVLSIVIVYRFCICFFNKNTALLSSTIISSSFIFLVYSSYARMYVTGILFSLMLLYYLYHILFSVSVSLKHYLLFSLACLLCAYNHHLSCLFAASAALFAFLYIPKSRIKFYLICSGLTVLFYLPCLPVTLYQLSNGGVGTVNGGWLPTPQAIDVYYFFKALFGTGYAGKLIMLILGILFLISIFKLIPISKKQILLFWLFTFNIFIIYFYSVYKNPIFQFSVLLFCGVCGIIFIASFSQFLKLKTVTIICACVSSLLIFQSVFIKKFFSSAQEHLFETQVKTASEFNVKFGKANVTSFFKTEDFFIYLYEKKFHTPLKYISLKDKFISSLALLDNYLKGLNETYIVVGNASAGEITLIKKYFPYVNTHFQGFFNNTLMLSKKFTTVNDHSVLNTISLKNSDLKLNVNDKKTICFIGDSIQFKVETNDDEFPFNIKLPLCNTNFKIGQSLIVEIDFFLDSIKNVKDEKFCVSVSDEGKDAVYFQSVLFANTYNPIKKIQHISLEYFVGSDHAQWKNKNFVMNFFIWKAKNTTYTIRNFKITQVDYNPDKWKLWN